MKVQQQARDNLIQVLDSVRGKKGLVLDLELSSPLSLIAEFPLLKEHGVEKIYHLEKNLQTECKSVIYITRPWIKNMKLISAEHMRKHRNDSVEFSIFMVPRKTLVCERILEDEGVYGDAKISEFPLDLIPLEEDVFSLELNNCFSDLYLRKDTSCIYSVAKAIMNLEKTNGIIPKIIGKGIHAKSLTDHLLRMKKENLHNKVFNNYSLDMDSILILERGSDLLTPMCTQLTYEGLIDEIYGIKSTFVSISPVMLGVIGSSSSAQKLKKVALNSTDKIFSQIRNVNFAMVGSALSQHAKRLFEDYEERHTLKTVTQIKDFVGKLGGLQTDHHALRLHTNLAEDITKHTVDSEFNKCLEIQQNLVAGIINPAHIDYIEEMIARQSPFKTVMRLLCILSLVSDGIPAKKYDFIRKEIIQTYGFRHMLTLDNLAKVGLFKRHEGIKDQYNRLRKAFRLIVDDVDEKEPNDISYVYSGFAPLLTRILQISCFKSISSAIPQSLVNIETSQNSKNNHFNVGWKSWEDVLRLIPGPLIDESQNVSDNLVPVRSQANGGKTTLVVFLGGCTFTEISAIRYLSKQYPDREFVILTTNITNGSEIIGSLFENSLLL